MPTVTTGAGVATEEVMPPRPQKSVISGEELRALLRLHRLSQNELADMLEVHYTTVSRWVRDKTPFTAAHLALLNEKITARKK